MESKSGNVLICSLSNFWLNELSPTFDLSHEDRLRYIDEKINEYRRGFKLSDEVTLRLPKREELDFLHDPLASELFGTTRLKLAKQHFFPKSIPNIRKQTRLQIIRY